MNNNVTTFHLYSLLSIFICHLRIHDIMCNIFVINVLSFSSNKATKNNFRDHLIIVILIVCIYIPDIVHYTDINLVPYSFYICFCFFY